jgi:predicted acetyltransferase
MYFVVKECYTYSFVVSVDHYPCGNESQFEKWWQDRKQNHVVFTITMNPVFFEYCVRHKSPVVMVLKATFNNISIISRRKKRQVGKNTIRCVTFCKNWKLFCWLYFYLKSYCDVWGMLPQHDLLYIFKNQILFLHNVKFIK